MKNILTSIVIVVLFIVSPCHSRGNKEVTESMKRLDGLLVQKKYDEVLQIIPYEISNNPDQFDKYQKIVKKVINIREDYNKKMYEVLEILENNPENEDSILKIMNELIKLDPEAESTTLFVNDLYENISFSINRKALFNIFESSSVAMTNSYKAALEIYFTVFDINRSEMINSNDVSLGKVLTLISTIEDELISHLDLQQEINNTVYDFILNFGSFSDDEVKNVMEIIAFIHKKIVATKDTLISLGTALLDYEQFYNANLKIKANNNIRFIYSAIFGIPEFGLLNVINQEWYIIYMNFIRKSLSHINQIQEVVITEYEQHKKIDSGKLNDLYRSIIYMESFTDILYKKESRDSSDDSADLLPQDIQYLMSTIIERFSYIKKHIMAYSF